MSFKDSVATDISKVFLNENEFAEIRSVKYDGILYRNKSIVLSGLTEEERAASGGDNAQGIYRVTHVMHCALSDVGGVLPEQGMKILISEGNYFRPYYIVTSNLEMGMVKLELGAYDE